MKNFPVRFLLVMVGGAAILVDWIGWFMWKELEWFGAWLWRCREEGVVIHYFGGFIGDIHVDGVIYGKGSL